MGSKSLGVTKTFFFKEKSGLCMCLLIDWANCSIVVLWILSLFPQHMLLYVLMWLLMVLNTTFCQRLYVHIIGQSSRSGQESVCFIWLSYFCATLIVTYVQAFLYFCRPSNWLPRHYVFDLSVRLHVRGCVCLAEAFSISSPCRHLLVPTVVCHSFSWMKFKCFCSRVHMS